MKNVIVTGGAGGLGVNIVKQHLAAGDRVWALDLRASEVMHQELERPENEGRLFFRECNIASSESVAAAVQDLPEHGITSIQRIYSCAGICRPQDRVPLGETDLDAIAGVVDINAVGFLRVVKAVLPLLHPDLSIVCVTSEAASIAANHRSQEYSYGMSKCAENMACVILQQYFDESIPGARVVCLHPGWLKTAMGGGDVAEVDPADSARDLIGIAQDLHDMPKTPMFMDHLRNPMPW